MVELTESDGFGGLSLPITIGTCRLSARAPAAITSIAPWPGRSDEADRVLRNLGLGFPRPGEVLVAGNTRAVWAGRATAFLLGAAPPRDLADHAALTDQSDAWAGLKLAGADAVPVLARLLPLDLRTDAFSPGASARTLLNHLPCLVIRKAEIAFEIYIYRSMVGTAIQELTEAMRSVAARASIR